MNCIAAGNSVRVPAIIHYETLRELERLNDSAQIVRLKASQVAYQRFQPYGCFICPH